MVIVVTNVSYYLINIVRSYGLYLTTIRLRQ